MYCTCEKDCPGLEPMVLNYKRIPKRMDWWKTKVVFKYRYKQYVFTIIRIYYLLISKFTFTYPHNMSGHIWIVNVDIFITEQ